MNIKQTIVAIVIALAMSVGLVGGGASAATADELAAQIAALQAQLLALTQQLSQVQGGTTATITGIPSGFTFATNLKLGSTGNDVKYLQIALNSNAATKVSESGAGSPGSESTYFGAKTKAAVVKFQEKYASEVLTPVGLTAGTGFVGAKTREKLNALIAGGVVTPPSTTTTTTTPVSAGLTVELASDTPAAGNVISDGASEAAGSQALIPALKLKFSTPAGTSAKVTTLKLKRLGISTDTDIPNVYLYDGDTKLADLTSLTTGVVTFTNSAGLFTVSGTKVITVKFDLHKDSTAGKTIGFGVNAAADVTTDASAVNGTYPVNGNIMTVAVVTDFGRLQVATTSNSTAVDPGKIGFEAFRFTLAASNQKIKIYSLTFQQLGSINKTDIQNIALYDGSTQLGSTVASLDSDGKVKIDLSATPYTIESGVTRTLALKVDVVNGSTRTIQLSLQKVSDIVAKDGNYDVYVAADTGTIGTYTVQYGQAATVNSGNLVISKRTDSPVGNIGLNGTNVTLAKYDVKAVGEDIKVSQLTVFASTSASVWNTLKNVRLIFDGVQIGTTQNGSGSGIASNTAYTVNVSFTVPAATTKVLEIRADIQGTGLGNADTIKAALIAGSSNAQRAISLGTFSFPSSEQAGNELTVVTAALSAAKNQSVGNVSVVNGATNVVLSSFLVTAGAAEGVDISKLTFRDAQNATGTAGTSRLGSAFTNLKAMYGSTQLGSTLVPNVGSPDTTYDFSPSPALSVGLGQTIRVDLVGNVLTGPTWTNGDSIGLTTLEGRGKVTNASSSVNLPSGWVVAVNGQTVTLSGAGTLSATVDPSTPVSSILYQGATAQTLGMWKLAANTIEDLNIISIYVFNATDTGNGNVKNLKLYCGDVQFGSTVDGLVSSAANFASAVPCTITKGSYKVMSLKADITPYADAQTGAGNYVQFYITVPATITGATTEGITALGAGTYAVTSGSGNKTANAQYPYRTSLAASIASVGGASGRTRAVSDKIASLTLTGNGGNGAVFGAATDAQDENLTGWATSSANLVSTSLSTTTTKIDGTYGLVYNASTMAATTTYAAVNIGDVRGYSKASLWLKSATTTSRIVFASNGTSTIGGIYNGAIASTTVTMAGVNTWTYAELNLPTTNTGTSTYIGVALTVDDNASSGVTTFIDAVRAYNDSITVDIGGNTTSTNIGTSISLKTTGGTEKAVGYYDYTNSKVVLVPTSQIDVGSSGLTLELITDTTKVLNTDTTAVETLTLSLDLGTASSAGDFRWNDQAVAATSSIAWLNGASPISVSLGY